LSWAKQQWWPSLNAHGRSIEKALVWDETEYEGNITMQWGSLSGQVQAQRFWTAVSNGAHCAGHSNTGLLSRNDKACRAPTGAPWDDGTNGKPLCNPIMWWNKGGALRGESPPRIAFFGKVMSAVDVPRYDEMTSTPLWEAPKGNAGAGVYHLRAKDDSWHLVYWLNTTQPVDIPVGSASYDATHLDYWNMSISLLGQAKPQDGRIHVVPPVENYILKLATSPRPDAVTVIN